MNEEKFIPAELTEIKMDSKEAEVKVKLMMENEVPLLENHLRIIRFNTGFQAGYLVNKLGDIIFFVSPNVDLEEYQDVINDLKRMREELGRKLKILLRQGGHLGKYQFDPDKIIESRRQEFTTF